MVRFTKRYKYSRMNGGKKKRRKTKKNKRRNEFVDRNFFAIAYVSTFFC